jgi:hypothetical protein
VNLQTAKCRAIPLDRPNGKQAWRVTHPLMTGGIDTFRPHDIALMLHRAVLEEQVELIKEQSWSA